MFYKNQLRRARRFVAHRVVSAPQKGLCLLSPNQAYLFFCEAVALMQKVGFFQEEAEIDEKRTTKELDGDRSPVNGQILKKLIFG